MTWEGRVGQHRCVRPIGALMLAPLSGIKAGDVWRCDDCGKRWRVARDKNSRLVFVEAS